VQYAAVAYDEELADRIRDLLPDGVEVTEKGMFGGLAFLVGGNMAVSASGRGGLMVRVDPAESDRLVAEPGVSRMEMRGREMDGWLRVAAETVSDDATLARWVLVGSDYAGSLPPK
jgi:TfoX/Sxy family transcriptional regulator of competence genes